MRKFGREKFGELVLELCRVVITRVGQKMGLIRLEPHPFAYHLVKL